MILIAGIGARPLSDRGDYRFFKRNYQFLGQSLTQFVSAPR